ncbi:MAG: pyridoxine 5'-phosphate synthase [Polyangiaceae bacterium]|nr:pyridoxine 5'-phosphate synthase [Polyangiaceae bacterium]
MSVRLHINIDHVATVRNARGTKYPDPLYAAHVCEAAGADGITAHLREDRRHIRDDDVERLRASITSHFNLECAATDEMRAIAERVVPDTVTLVPERRQERTTEGGLDVAGQRQAVETFIAMCKRVGIRASLFIAPDDVSVQLSHALGADQIELHTGEYCHAFEPGKAAQRDKELARLVRATELARSLGLEVAAGHGLTRHNVGPVVAIPGVAEVNIGHSVIADAVFLGLSEAVQKLRAAIERHASRA